MTRTLLLHGHYHTLSSFSLVNRHLARGLSALGYRVTIMPSDGPAPIGPPVQDPDIYLVNDHPYDWTNAPGRVNVFLLEYEYARILVKDKPLVERLNHFFDLVLAPSHFVRDVCRRSGVRIPVVVCPLGFDPVEFHPGVPPAALPTTKTFKFLYLGGANERKGTDLLLSAFAGEFTAQDDAVLVLKTFSYEDHRAAFERAVARCRRRRSAPEILHVHGSEDSIASYYTAADWLVFPTRGEGFGLPVLESLACGRPVLVTSGTAPVDFCTRENSRLIPSERVTRRGKQQREPDLRALRQLLRAAYEGRLLSPDPKQISATVADWTWEHTVAQIHAALERSRPRRLVPRVNSNGRVGYAFFQRGPTSWKKVALHVDRTLARHFDYVPLDFHSTPTAQPLRVIVGESGSALEHFLRAAELNPNVKRILTRGNGPAETVMAIENRERLLCGAPERLYSALERWRHRRAAELADQIVVCGHGSARLYLEANYPRQKIKTLHLGIDVQPEPAYRSGRTVRFLYIATNPFRKGVRVLFRAWDTLRPKHAELICIADTDILRSPLLLRYLVRNPNIVFKPLVPHRQLTFEYMNCDCQVLPSFEEGFPVAVAEGMGFGKPAILSRDLGLSELIVQQENGLVVPQGSVRALVQALAYFCEDRNRLYRMGEAAYETARACTWERFEQGFAEFVQSQRNDA